MSTNETSSIMEIHFHGSIQPLSDQEVISIAGYFGFKDYGFPGIMRFGFVVIWYATLIFCGI